MFCTTCNLPLAYTEQTKHITHCALCGTLYVPSNMNEVFIGGMYGIATEKRTQQAQMAQHIYEFLGHKEHKYTAIEAGTGTGKSFAYLVSSILHAEMRKKPPIADLSLPTPNNRIVISTAKKTLQEQLTTKDLPYLEKKLGLKLKYALLKGNGDYLCLHLRNAVPPGDRNRYKEMTQDALVQKTYIDKNRWGSETPAWWSDVSVDNCPNSKGCASKAYCKPRARVYDIMVVNHHLLAYDLMLNGSLFGGYHTLIIDEAHEAIEAFRNAISNKLSVPQLRYTLKALKSDTDIPELLPLLGSPIKYSDLYNRMADVLQRLIDAHKTGLGLQDKKTSSIPTEKCKDLFSDTLDADLISLIRLLVPLAESPLPSTALGLKETDPLKYAAILHAKSKLTKIARLCDKLRSIVNRATTYSTAHIFKINDKEIEQVPLKMDVFFKNKTETIPKCILTSATLSNAGDFEYRLNTFGLPLKNTPNLNVKSPYDLKKQAILYAPFSTHMPTHIEGDSRDEWLEQCKVAILNISKAIKHHILILFTSNRDKDELYDLLAPELLKLGLTPINQEGNAALTVENYKQEKAPVLFGCKSLWEGLNLPGDELRCVIIPKLPFPTPADPVNAKMQETTPDYFMSVAVPKMIDSMRQGTGRLIRSAQDKGVVVILDGRIWAGTSDANRYSDRITALKNAKSANELNSLLNKSGYGKKLMSALGYRVCPNLTEVYEWVNRNM
jgi:ATP-dependent DNA helicase DinG